MTSGPARHKHSSLLWPAGGDEERIVCNIDGNPSKAGATIASQQEQQQQHNKMRMKDIEKSGHDDQTF